MNIPSKYDPSKTEEKWYSYWMEKKFFYSQPDEREAYTIVIPPPNVTGVLHMGHMLNNTIQDILIRRARMQGKNACWVPGTDHASIATEARVVAKLKEEGIDKAKLSREEFLKHAWEWKEKHGGIILEQLKKLGASCDWKRTKFTMDANMSESVIQVFVDLYNKGLIYRGIRMVNWDPEAQTALSDEEVIFKELQSKLYYVNYKIVGEENFVTIATTRPETILGDTAVCINPNDDRYKDLKGKKVIVPMVGRVVPIIEDEYVDMEFGTGCLKITPAHDINDYEIGIKHNLDSIDIFNDDGTLSEKAGLFVGVERFEARRLSEKKLEEEKCLVKVEDYINKVGFSERTDAVIEPKLSMQWFLNMKDISKPALENIMNDNIGLHPEKFKNTYKHWMENVKDWCISRQLWWGQRIPAYYLPNGEFVIANSIDEALKLAIEKTKDNTLKQEDLKQDEDVLDTWFSSWLWPISVFDGIRNPDNKEIKYYYPTNDLVTAPEILFFWVARMIISGYKYMGEKPFKDVYLTGIVRDKQRRKMSKSLGNSPDPIELMKKYSADGVRIGMLLCSPAGNDLLFDESLTEQGRNFANKIWNAFRLVKSWKVDESIEQPQVSVEASNWFSSKLNEAQLQIEKQLKEYRISEAVMTLYKLFWDDFSSWYLEAIKPAYQQAIDKRTINSCIEFFEILLQILHPFMPFITEEIWHYIKERDDEDCIIVSQLKDVKQVDTKLIENFGIAQEVISTIRTIRKEKQIANKEMLELYYSSKDSFILPFREIIKKLAFVSEIKEIVDKPDAVTSFIVNTNEFYIPLSDKVDVEKEIQKLQKDLDYNIEFLRLVEKKLSNDKFIKNAPEKVVDMERKKEADAKTKIKVLEDQIASYK